MSINLTAQINISSTSLKKANLIFNEHKHQKKIIDEQNTQLESYENKISVFDQKVAGFQKVISNQVEIIDLTNQKSAIEKTNLNNQISVLKKQNKKSTIIAIVAVALATTILISK